jgi:hypothetical protein
MSGGIELHRVRNSIHHDGLGKHVALDRKVSLEQANDSHHSSTDFAGTKKQDRFISRLPATHTCDSLFDIAYSASHLPDDDL